MRQKTNTRLQKKYNRLFKRLQQALQSGQFLTYSAAKKARLLARLQAYENRLLRRGVAVLGAAALLMSIGEVLAQQPVKVGEEFRVNSNIARLQQKPRIAMNEIGDFVITWYNFSQDGSGDGIYAQRYKKDGTPEGNEFRVNTYTDSDQKNPSVAMDNDGDFIIVWQSGSFYGLDQDGSDDGVYAQRYNRNGMPEGDEFRVNSYTTSPQLMPNVAMNDDGNFIVAWQSYGQDGDDYGIYAQRYSNNGTPNGNEFQVNTYTNSSQVSPEVSIHNDGSFIIVWQSDEQDGNKYGIYGQRYLKNGLPDGNEFQVNIQTENDQKNPSIVMDENGDFIIAWQSRYDGQNIFYNNIFLRRFLHNGTPNGGELVVSPEDSQVSSGPDLAINGDNTLVISWDDSKMNGKVYNYNEETSSFQINCTDDNTVRESSIVINNNGSIVGTWQSNSRNGIYAQRYKILTPTIPDINTLILNTCTRPYSADFDPVTDAIGYQVQITVLARNGEVLTRRIDDNEISGNFNIPRRLLGTDVEIQIAAIFLDDETGEEIVGEFSETGIFTLGCDEVDNLVLESRDIALNAIQLSPNPVQSLLQIQFQSNTENSTKLKVLSLNGKIILEQNHQLFTGQNDLNFNVESLPAGQYFLQIQTAEGIEHQKFVKQ